MAEYDEKIYKSDWRKMTNAIHDVNYVKEFE